MIAALLRHTVLLLTWRHDGRGLPRTFGPLLALMLACAVVAWFRWDSVQTAAATVLTLTVVATFCSPRMAAGMALISIGVDAAGLLGLAGSAAAAWEWSAYTVLGGRLALARP
jgi:hypothetical protein